MVPSYYDSKMCGKIFQPNKNRAVEAGEEYAKKNGIPSSHASLNKSPNVVLTVIDAQIDFISEEGNLCVPGAIADIDRTNRFIYNNIDKITRIVASLDTHYLFQPFHRLNWIAGQNPAVRMSGPKKGQAYLSGEHPDAFTLISLDSINKSQWIPTRHPIKMREMIQKLEQQHKKMLCIWPFHCELGTPGHAFDPTFFEAMYFHAAARKDQYFVPTKGMSALSEHYGILQAEVQFSEDINTQPNTTMLSIWEEADIVLFLGQAKSHCCLETLNQVVDKFKGTDLIKKLYVVEDCMSNVPDIRDDSGNIIVPFEKITNDRFNEFRQMGVNFMNSTDKIPV